MIDLNDIGKYRENNRIEAKRAQGGLPSSLWETYSAFANSFGGIILLGVIELGDKSLQTISIPDPEKLVSEFWNIINNPQKVSNNILNDQDVQIVESQGNRIVIIEVPRANRQEKPIYIGENPFSGTYRRNGEGDYHCSPNEVRNMLQDQSQISQDMRMLNKMTMEVFDYDSIQKYRTRIFKLQHLYKWGSLENDTFLQNLGAVAKGQDGVLHPTAGGLLMFGFEHEIIREFPYYYLDYQERLEDKNVSSYHIVSNSGEWSGNIFDFYFSVYHKLVQDIPLKLGDTDKQVYQALAEALANAIIHANYYESSGLVIQKMRDSIIIKNPGVLRIGTNDAISGGISDPRNVLLAKMFNLLNIGEHTGMGISKIYSVWKQQGWALPQIYEEFAPDRTILLLPFTKSIDKKMFSRAYKKVAISNVQKKQIIIEYLTDKVSCRIDDICKLLNLKRRHARTLLQELVKSDIIIVEGKKQDRIYRLKS